LGIAYHPGHVWKILDDPGWSGQRPVGRVSGSAAGGAYAGPPQKKAHKEGRTILFIDESGISQRPHRVRTWSPCGETPPLPYHFHGDSESSRNPGVQSLTY